MAAGGEAAEDLVQVELGTTRLRVAAVQPVDDENPRS